VEQWKEEEGKETNLLQNKKIYTRYSGNEENGYPVTVLNKTMTNVTKEPSDIYIKNLKEEILEDIMEKFMETN
jgi:hypothetical protein